MKKVHQKMMTRDCEEEWSVSLERQDVMEVT